MIVSNHSLPNQAPSLDDFRDAVARSGRQETENVQGKMPSGRTVAWDGGVGDDSATRSAFMDALKQSFSGGIQTAVARELGLDSSSGKPLSARTVEHAIDMAETAQKAMSGVDFFTQLSCSASSNGAEFQRVCTEMGVAPANIDAPARQQIDRFMDQQFQSAAEQGRSPVDIGTARVWLQQAMSSAQA